MADQQPSSSEASSSQSDVRSRSLNAADQNTPPTPPPSTSSGQCSGKPKRRPTVTPRTFTRFFAPRSSLGRSKKIGASRQALREITASAFNRRRPPQRRTPTRDTVQFFGDENDEVEGTSKKRKRKIPASPDTTPGLSSPLKRIRHESRDAFDDTEAETTDSDVGLTEDESGKEKGVHKRKPRVIDPIESRLGVWLGWNLCRQTGRIDQPRLTRDVSCGVDWQNETSSFFADPEDTYFCDDVANTRHSSIPFCTTSCNTNSLIAIGDEDGGVRLLESAQNGKPGFSKAYLTFRPHTNAILDLNFSPDDRLLATASGDQTGHVIDMPTQRAIYTLAGHTSTVKQTRFQPGSSNVIATSSRDGSVQIWDLRCKGIDVPVRKLKVSLEPSDNVASRRAYTTQKITHARMVNTISEAHSTLSEILSTSAKFPRDAPRNIDSNRRRAGDVSVTALSFLSQGREHLLLTGSEANATVKLWDLRTTHNQRRRSRAVPLSTSHQPDSHTHHRQFGLTSISLSGDGARLYTLCRDNTVYVYSTSHLILGHAPELSSSSYRPRRVNGVEKQGLGPLYGFRHPSFHATSFYVKSALRPALNDKSEILAVGSSNSCAVLFPTDERYLLRSSTHHTSPLSSPLSSQDLSSRIPFHRTDSGSGLAARLNDTIPIYQHGSALIRGHDREVTGVTWTNEGNLVSVGDDFTARCWREGRKGEARSLRLGGEGEGKRWGRGWAEVEEGWDDEDG